MQTHPYVVTIYILSDSGKRIGNPSRRNLQISEHDGLLGSGSSSKMTGYASGTSAPKFRSIDQANHNKSSSAYQPPWPYKVSPGVFTVCVCQNSCPV